MVEEAQPEEKAVEREGVAGLFQTLDLAIAAGALGAFPWHTYEHGRNRAAALL